MDEWGQVNAELGVYRPVAPHWYLAVIGVDPEVQGKGYGSTLLSGLLGRADADGAPAHLECDRAESVRFYLGRGFDVRHEVDVHGVRCRVLGRGFADAGADLCDSVRQAHPG